MKILIVDDERSIRNSLKEILEMEDYQVDTAENGAEVAAGEVETFFGNLEAGKTYYYWVRATNQGGTSGFSEYASGYRRVAAPAAPTGVSASDGLSSTEIVVSWNAVASATSYSVWRAATPCRKCRAAWRAGMRNPPRLGVRG